MTEEIVQINTNIGRSKDDELRRIAAELRASRSEVVRLAITKFIQGYRLVGMEYLPGPEGAERPLLITVENKNE